MRKIGEVFQLNGVKLKVEKAKYKGNKSCIGCFLYNKECFDDVVFTGRCDAKGREDKTDVIFVEVED